MAIPDFTFSATANAILRAGMTPVIFPCLYETAQMDLDVLLENLDEFDAILFVVPFGHSIVGLPKLLEISRRSGKPLVFDMAGAWPMDVADHACCYSLHAAKSLPVGEGGLIKFPFYEQREKAKRLAAFDFDDSKSAVSSFGMNGKLDDLHCAILRAQLSRKNYLVRRISLRASLTLHYQEELEGLCDPLPEKLGYPSMCVLRGLNAARIVEAGAEQGIVFRRYYYPLLSDQPGFKGLDFISPSDPRLGSYIAFPSDVTHDEFLRVVECARGASQP